MSWKEIIKEDVVYLGETILKLTSPRQFLENMQDIVGGEIEGAHEKYGANFVLTFDGGFLKVQNRGRGEYYVNFNGDVLGGDFNLEKLRDITEKKLREIFLKKFR